MNLNISPLMTKSNMYYKYRLLNEEEVEMR